MNTLATALTCFTVLAFSAAAWDAWRRYLALRTFDVTEMQELRNRCAESLTQLEISNAAFRADIEKHRDQMLAKYDRNESAIKAALAETKAEYTQVTQQLSSLRLSRGVQR